MSKLFVLFVVVLLCDYNSCSEVKYRYLKDLGRFDSFLYNYFRILIDNYSPKKLVKYCKQVAWVLMDQSEYREMDKLADYIRDLCKDGESLKDDLRQYQKEVLKELPARLAFFKAINEAFTQLQTVQFHSYLQYVVEYSGHPNPDVSDKTKWLVRDIIINNIKNYLSGRDRYELKKKLKRAVKEYKRESVNSDPDFNFLVEYFKTKKYPLD